jgi:diguanylate cyclase (GGDEF)-like protein
MSLNELIALDLRGRPTSPPPTVGSVPPVGTDRPRPVDDPSIDLRQLIVRALDVVRELVAAEEEEDDSALLAELTNLAAQFGVSATPAPTTAGHDCLERARPLASRSKTRRSEQRQELAAIVSLVREAVATAGLQLDSIHSEIEASGDRFEAITSQENPKLVREQVMAHVTLLKQLVAEKRKAWESQRETFANKIATLEQQLNVTKRQASTDALTGVANQGSFQAEYQARVNRAGSQLVLAVLDVDGFKLVNDTFGHAEGDRVLRTLGQGLRQALRDNDFIARVGGDEFAVLLEKVTLRQAEMRFTSILTRLRADMGKAGEGCAAPSLSCGLAELSAGDTPASLYERADQALYSAKRAGKNRVASKTRPLMRDLMRR